MEIFNKTILKTEINTCTYFKYNFLISHFIKISPIGFKKILDAETHKKNIEG